MAVITKESRIEFRIPIEDKKDIEDAARFKNVSVSSYILSVVLKQAKIDLQEAEMISLNNKERDLLMESLSHPNKANKALKELFK